MNAVRKAKLESAFSRLVQLSGPLQTIAIGERLAADCSPGDEALATRAETLEDAASGVVYMVGRLQEVLPR